MMLRTLLTEIILRVETKARYDQDAIAGKFAVSNVVIYLYNNHLSWPLELLVLRGLCLLWAQQEVRCQYLYLYHSWQSLHSHLGKLEDLIAGSQKGTRGH